MRLCDSDIEKLLDHGTLKISPRPSIKFIHGATVDIRLGNKFRKFRTHDISFIDLSKNKKDISNKLNHVMHEEIFLSRKEKFFLYPSELALAISYECITMPNNLVGWLDGRSSLARLGLMIHMTSHRIDPGWHGNIVLEFFNASKFLLSLNPGMLIGAISFEFLSGPAERPYNYRKNAKYKNQNHPIASLIYKD